MLDIQCLQFTLSRSKDNTPLNILKVVKRRQGVKQRLFWLFFRIFEIMIIYLFIFALLLSLVAQTLWIVYLNS